MAYVTKDKIRALTGIDTSTVSDNDMDTLIALADAQIDLKGGSPTSSQQELASLFLTSHLCEMKLQGNQISASIGGQGISFREKTIWYDMYEKIIKTITGTNIYVVNGQ